MNLGPGNIFMAIRLLGLGLWLTSLILPLSVMAQLQTPAVPGYNPWSINSPYTQFQNPIPAAVPPAIFTRPQPGQQSYRASNPWAYPPVPGARGFQPQQPAQAPASRLDLETSIDSTEAYVHQNLVMTIQVISTVNLKTIAAELPDTDDVIFRQLGDATASTRTRLGQREIVNTLYYQLTPLRSGRIDLESVRVTGVMDSNTPNETRYEAIANRPVQLMVADPEPGVQPWLPLHELELSASLSNDERIGEGEPITLTVEQHAVGMSGAQLPSLEAQLQAPGHRLYREKSEYEGTISKQGQLVGTRIDRYTLVPQQGNSVEIPAIGVDWWNVARQRKETAVLPGRLLNQRDRRPGEQGQVESQDLGYAAGSVLMWLSLLAAAFLLGRFWPRLAPGLRRTAGWFWQWLYSASRPLHRRLATELVRLSPQRNLHRLRRQIADNLPRSARLWFCVRSADEEQDADDWSQVLRFLISRRLGLPAQLPMAKLAEHIIEIHPGADSDKIRSLLSELEAALFAGHSMRDFNCWKKEFKHQIRPRLFAGLRFSRRDLRDSGLPSLNPTVT